MSDSLHTPKTLLQKRKEPEIFLLTDTFALSHPICQIYVKFLVAGKSQSPIEVRLLQLLQYVGLVGSKSEHVFPNGTHTWSTYINVHTDGRQKTQHSHEQTVPVA